ncbi:hypothetical protein NNC19_17940 [Clostridium sp. SHJSY1]|uniref:hypothetical protein n=1 Tax=Clostridium sp. SHJSY1 TaxID=2942483 RepID=UPI002876ABEA|nr:hypothetical protein [Clostridium sp. SHJSY1]MDS0527576.1 hypothetical protein [Clostridium sp. SHJSY1]
MANRIKKQDAENAVARYIEKIEEARRKIIKNFNEMDLENSDVNEEYRELVEAITRDCNRLIRDIEEYNFR